MNKQLGFATMPHYQSLSDSTKIKLAEGLLASRKAMKEGTTSVLPIKPPKPVTRKAHRISSYDSPRSVGGFSYNNMQINQNGGRKTVRKVSIKNGKGHKMISEYKKSKKMFTVKKPLSIIEIVTIQRGQFIPGLFSDCKGPGCIKNKTMKKH